MSNWYLNEAHAASRRRDIEREATAAELGRLAQAARRADRSPRPSDRAVAAPVARMPGIGPVAGAWRSLGRGLGAVRAGDGARLIASGRAVRGAGGT